MSPSRVLAGIPPLPIARPPPHAWEGPGNRTANGVPTERIKSRLLSTWESGCLGTGCVCVGGKGDRSPPTPSPGEGEPWVGLERGVGVSPPRSQGRGGAGGGRDSTQRSLMTQAPGWGPDQHIFRRKVTVGPSLRDIPPSHLPPRGPGNQAPGRGAVCARAWAPRGLRPERRRAEPGTPLASRNARDTRGPGGEAGTLPPKTSLCARAHAPARSRPGDLALAPPQTPRAEPPTHAQTTPTAPGTRWPRAPPAHARSPRFRGPPAPPGGHTGAARAARGDPCARPAGGPGRRGSGPRGRSPCPRPAQGSSWTPPCGPRRGALPLCPFFLFQSRTARVRL